VNLSTQRQNWHRKGLNHVCTGKFGDLWWLG
jgi:hypothetical protein